MGRTHTFDDPDTRLTPPWWSWPIAVLAGLILAAGSLSYAPAGRLNVLWLWLLWAGLPFCGALVSLLISVRGRARPWLFQWRGWRLHWYPTRAQRWQMLYYLQLLWLVVGVGVLLGFLGLLLFSDLAFGWSSTLFDESRPPQGLFRALAAPWQAFWPAAVPDLALLEATRYVRIAPEQGGIERAGDWWPFLLASLIVYNLLPRALLAGLSGWQWHRTERRKGQPTVEAPAFASSSFPVAEPTSERVREWENALVLNWELKDAGAPALGFDSWENDEQTLTRLLTPSTERLLWRVPANRSPVAELADLVQRARSAGAPVQGLWVKADGRTQPERHIASWRHFAQTHQLVWVNDE